MKASAGYSEDFDEFYTYDDLHRLNELDRGDLNGTQTGIVTTPTNSTTFTEDWSLDALGNWTDFEQDTDADGTLETDQTRTHNTANEIGTISTWQNPVHDAAGNMTTMPDPGSLTAAMTATYDAWNRLVGTADSGSTATTFAYDGLGRRIKLTQSGTTRHFYHDGQRVIEERLNSSTSAERQFVWGMRYVDELILRDRDTDSGGSGDWGLEDSGLNERILPMQDANFNVVCLAGDTGTILERYAYSAYGECKFLDADFSVDSGGTDYDWTYLYTGRRLDPETGLYHYRTRPYHAQLGRFLGRDKILYRGGDMNLYNYVGNDPLGAVDPMGTACKVLRWYRHTGKEAPQKILDLDKAFVPIPGKESGPYQVTANEARKVAQGRYPDYKDQFKKWKETGTRIIQIKGYTTKSKIKLKDGSFFLTTHLHFISADVKEDNPGDCYVLVEETGRKTFEGNGKSWKRTHDLDPDDSWDFDPPGVIGTNSDHVMIGTLKPNSGSHCDANKRIVFADIVVIPNTLSYDVGEGIMSDIKLGKITARQRMIIYSRANRDDGAAKNSRFDFSLHTDADHKGIWRESGHASGPYKWPEP